MTAELVTRLINARDALKSVSPSNEARRAARDAMADAANALSKADQIIAMQSQGEEGGSSRDHALSAGSALDGWRPIETAPKDGSEVLLWIVHTGSDFNPEPFERLSVGYWERANTTPGFEHPARWERKWIGEPTHWQTMPQPPSPEASDHRSRDAIPPSDRREVEVLREALKALRAVMMLRDRGFTKAVAKELGLEVQAAMSNTWIEIPYARARQALSQADAIAREQG